MSEIKKNGAPTMKTIGALGDVYTDISTGAQYKCTGSYNIGGQLEYEWKKLNNTLEKEESVDMKLEKTEEPEEPIDEQPVEPEEITEPEPKQEEVADEQPKEEPKQEIKNPNPNHGKPNNRPNNRTDYASKFKG